MVALRIPGAPEFVKVAWKAASGTNDYVFRLRETVDYADHLSLAHRRTVPKVVNPLYFLIPLGSQTTETGAVF